jgi:hypothetical protein
MHSSSQPHNLSSSTNIKVTKGRAIAQAVSPWLPLAAARVRSQVRLCGMCGAKSGAGAGFLRVLRFPLPILIPPTAPHSLLPCGAGRISQLVADVRSGLCLTPLPRNLKKKWSNQGVRDWRKIRMHLSDKKQIKHFGRNILSHTITG